MVDDTCLRVYQRANTKYFLLLLMLGLNTTVMRAQDAPKKKYDKHGAEWTTLRGNNNRDGRVVTKG